MARASTALLLALAFAGCPAPHPGGPADGCGFEVQTDSGLVDSCLPADGGSQSCRPSFDAGLAFGPPVDLAAGVGPWLVRTADFNGDGLPDLAVTNGGGFQPGGVTGQSVSLLLGQHGAGFSAPATFRTGDSPRGVAVADLNGDGLPDLAVGSCGASPALQILTGDRQAGLSLGASVPLDVCPWAAATMTRTGGPDAIAIVGPGLSVNAADGGQLLLLSPADGGWAVTQSYPMSSVPVAVASADLNGDGQPDLIVASYDGLQGSPSITVYLGQPAGTLTALPAMSFTDFDLFYDLVALDFDGDGKPDLALINSGESRLDVALGNGDGTFRAPAAFDTEAFPVSIAAADVDGDGRPDLILGYEGGLGGVQIFQNLGGGRFSTAADVPAGSPVFGVAAGNLLGNGLVDVAAASVGTDSVVILAGSCAPDAPFAWDGGAFTEAPSAPPVLVAYNGGPVLAHPQLFSITFDDDPNQGLDEADDQFLSTSPWLQLVGQDYGVGSGSYLGHLRLPTAPPTIADNELDQDGEILGLIATLVADGGAPPPGAVDGGTISDLVYDIHFPATTQISYGPYTACQGVDGWHSFGSLNGVRFAYIVMPTCVADTPTLESFNSHELIESSTDPSGYSGWCVDDQNLPQGNLPGEVGDLCVDIGPSTIAQDGGFWVQRIWSNSAADAGQDPCIPAPAEPYYNLSAAPANTLTIAGGQSGTFTLTGWSTAPTAAWTLAVEATPAFNSQSFTPSSLKLSQTTLGNGEAATLEVGVPEGAPSGSATLILVYSALSGAEYNSLPLLVEVP